MLSHRSVDHSEVVGSNCCLADASSAHRLISDEHPAEETTAPPKDGGHERSGHLGGGARGVDDNTDELMFGRTEYLIDERDCFVKIDVLRTGSGTSDIEVDWENKFETGRNSSFVQQSSTLRFRAGEFVRELSLVVKDDSSWSVEAVQRLTLTSVRANGAAMRGAGAFDGADDKEEAEAGGARLHKLGPLSSTEVVVLNDDLFPERRNPNGSRVRLGFGFVLHNWRLLRDKARWGVLFKLYPGIYLVSKQLIQMFMIFDVLTADAGTQRARRDALFLLVALYVVNFLLLHTADHKFAGLKLGGAATLQLRTAIMNKTLKLSPRSHAEFPAGRVSEILDTQAGDLCCCFLRTTPTSGVWGGVGRISACRGACGGVGRISACRGSSSDTR